MKIYHKTAIGFLSEVIENKLYFSQEEARARDEAEAISQLVELTQEEVCLVLQQSPDRDQRLTNAILYTAKVITSRRDELLMEQHEVDRRASITSEIQRAAE